MYENRLDYIYILINIIHEKSYLLKNLLFINYGESIFMNFIEKSYLLKNLLFINYGESIFMNFILGNIFTHIYIYINYFHDFLSIRYNGIKDISDLQLYRVPSLKALFLQGFNSIK